MLNYFRVAALILFAIGVSTISPQVVSAQTMDELQQELDNAKEESDAFVEEFQAEVQEKADQFAEDQQNNSADSEITESEERFLDSYDRTLDAYEDNSESVGDFGDLFGKLFVGGTIITLIVFSVFAVIGLVGFIFNIVMIVDCAKRDDENKAIWLITMVLGLFLGWGWIAAIIYYFVSRGSTSGTVNSPTQTTDGQNPPSSTVSY